MMFMHTPLSVIKKAGDRLYHDELQVYRGKDFIVSEHIHIHQPSIDEIYEYGERDYYAMVYNITATPQTIKSQLWDMQPRIDYTQITQFELFCCLLHNMYPQEKTAILFGDLDFRKFGIMQKEDGSFMLCQIIDNDMVVIDEYTYLMITDFLRQMHIIEKDEKLPANATTKMILIDDAREERFKNRGKEYHSQLKNLISAMINCEEFKYNHSDVWDMKINAFMDSVKRILKIKNANLLLQSAYSGFGGVNLKDVRKQVDWLGDLD